MLAGKFFRLRSSNTLTNFRWWLWLCKNGKTVLTLYHFCLRRLIPYFSLCNLLTQYPLHQCWQSRLLAPTSRDGTEAKSRYNFLVAALALYNLEDWTVFKPFLLTLSPFSLPELATGGILIENGYGQENGEKTVREKNATNSATTKINSGYCCFFHTRFLKSSEPLRQRSFMETVSPGVTRFQRRPKISINQIFL